MANTGPYVVPVGSLYRGPFADAGDEVPAEYLDWLGIARP